MTKHIQIFRPGKHTAMSGAALSFSESDLAATAAAYDPAKHEAPIVCGHPQHDAPAYGWVGKLAFADGALEAAPTQIDAAFAELVAKGSYKKISASFYAPDSPSNPVPGVYYLRHVGFLGAMPPGVKGLRNPSFAEAEHGIVEFADYEDAVNAGVLRGLRDWIIGKFGLADADQAIPGYAVATLEDAARQSDPDETDSPAVPNPSFIEKGSDQVTPEQKAALEAENASLKQQLAAAAERDKAAHLAAKHTANVAFAEGLVVAGKMLPSQKEAAVATLDYIDSAEKIMEFGEGDAKQPLGDAFKAMLQATAKQVEFAEVSQADTAKAGAAAYTAPRGFEVDQDKMAMHQKALQYAESNKCDYVTAVRAVGAV